MKNSITILIALFLSVNAFAQTNMQIRKTDNSIISVPISEIDSVYYEASSSFTCGDEITDIDGNTYSTVEIGSQCWIGENLKVTHYPNGDAIPLITDNTTWNNLADDNTSDAYSYYNNNANNEADTYGALYTYAAAIGDNWARDNVENQGVCPDGWHLPTDAEWIALTNYLGGAAGGKLKEIGTTHWQSPNTGATNEAGFTALPGGGRSSDGAFGGIGGSCNWWSTTEYNASDAWYRNLYYNNSDVSRNSYSKNIGFSVRCVMD